MKWNSPAAAAFFKTAPHRPSAIEIATDQRTFGPWSATAGGLAVRFARFGNGVIGFPVAVLLHELGHFLSFAALGFEGITLRYASVEWHGGQEFWHLIRTGNTLAASALAEPWRVAVAIGAGPAMTYLAVAACALLIRGLGPSSLILAVALAAPLRSVSVVPVLRDKLFEHELTARLDETRLATLTGMSETLLLAFALVFLIAGWWLVVRAVPQGQRRQHIVPVLGGIAVAGPLWLFWVGPWLLP